MTFSVSPSPRRRRYLVIGIGLGMVLIVASVWAVFATRNRVLERRKAAIERAERRVMALGGCLTQLNRRGNWMISLAETSARDIDLALLSEDLDGASSVVEINLVGTQITDAGLSSLETLKGLEYLEVCDTLVTAAGAERLHAALPRCRIVYGHSGQSTGIGGYADPRPEARSSSESPK